MYPYILALEQIHLSGVCNSNHFWERDRYSFDNIQKVLHIETTTIRKKLHVIRAKKIHIPQKAILLKEPALRISICSASLNMDQSEQDV